MKPTIVCDKCHFEWELIETDIQILELDEKTGTKMRFFQCPECSEEYIIDITDAELRKQISIFKRMQKKYQRMYMKHESETRLRNYIEKLQKKKNEVHLMEANLRRKWTHGERLHKNG